MEKRHAVSWGSFNFIVKVLYPITWPNAYAAYDVNASDIMKSSSANLWLLLNIL